MFIRLKPTIVLTASLSLVVALTACSGSSGDTSPPPTSTRFVVNPVAAGHGYLQLGKNQYPFDGVICSTGPVDSDPKDTIRDFGAYANFKLDGTLVVVSLTRYENRTQGAVPTRTDTALVQMQGKNEVKGLKAQRAQVIGNSVWKDVYDPTAKGPLIVHRGDRYEAKGQFGPPDLGAVPKPGATTTTTLPGTSESTPGELVLRCPAKSVSPTTIAGGSPTPTGSPSSPPPPAPSTSGR